MSGTGSQQINAAWICEQLAAFYTQPLQAQDLLAVRQVQRDVIVIGPDGRKFRLSARPKAQPVKRKEK
jgi:hypothetical protein